MFWAPMLWCRKDLIRDVSKRDWGSQNEGCVSKTAVSEKQCIWCLSMFPLQKFCSVYFATLERPCTQMHMREIYICVCVWHLLWEHQAGTFSVIFLAAKALAMVLLSSTSTSLSDIFLHWVWTLLHSWHHKPRHCKYIVKVLPTVGMFEIATLNLELNLCL